MLKQIPKSHKRANNSNELTTSGNVNRRVYYKLEQ